MERLRGATAMVAVSRVLVIGLGGACACACNVGPRGVDGNFGGGTEPGSAGSEGAGGDTGGQDSTDAEDSDGLPRLDVANGSAGTDGDEVDECSIIMDGAGVDCDEQAPPNSFDPEIQWVWEGDGDFIHSVTTPLVANLDDDNGDGRIDLCDVPEVVVLAGRSAVNDVGHLYVLSGETGEVELEIETDLVVDLNPAIGDIDGDGLPEIVAGQYLGILGANLVAFENDGTLKWVGEGCGSYGDALALADLDNDGDIEIFGAGSVYDHEGHRLFTVAGTSSWAANTAADLDGDGDLEIISGSHALHHDGSIYYANPEVTAAGYPQVADLDEDGEPEILVTTYKGFWILEHDGTTKLGPLTPTDDPPTGTNWERPATIHDFDGDDLPEFAQSSGANYATFERDGSLIWNSPIVEVSGIASGTAFDFLGDGTAEAMYADEYNMFIFGGDGEVLMQIPRSSTTLTEYPIVADIDNDDSAEIVVVSNSSFGGGSPTVQVIRDAQDRWIQARRIWNQHTYHVTNVYEDGTIPQFEQPNWEIFNTFRTNAQIEGGQACKPPPEG